MGSSKGRNPFGGSLRLPEGRASLWELGQEPWGARRGCSAGGRAWGRQRPEGQREGPAQGWGHVLLCQRDRFWVGRGDHEADPGGADGVSGAVGHFPNVSAVLLQGVVGSAADLALGDRNRSQRHGRNPRPLLQPGGTTGTPQPLLRASPRACPSPETHVPAPPCPQPAGTQPCLLRQPRQADSHSGRDEKAFPGFVWLSFSEKPAAELAGAAGRCPTPATPAVAAGSAVPSLGQPFSRHSE